MGEVYLAKDVRLDRNAAIKLLPDEWADDQGRRRRFLQEAKAASALNQFGKRRNGRVSSASRTGRGHFE